MNILHIQSSFSTNIMWCDLPLDYN